MKTTFDFNFKLYQAVKQHGYHYTYTHEVKRSCQLKNFPLITYKLVFRKNNLNLNKKVVCIVLIYASKNTVVFFTERTILWNKRLY